ncbi:endolytic transglycosylase MltG [Legionella jordanis]|uniref:Endolytic murein transglycosylase n=1 Tax=Legionella jordanis TaxID=456 RepID=A0A0W0V7H2_9GAMM|nr:endolytic transglycosylase MltG [Legionella jordanis]KTD16064.1 periplasmic solute-binding protein [Legionella jordanis]RMX04703.1 endolytic transglycosylase MltG [Legionella jordanis]RMX18412.1 endolytic transglycosylase MltG [Legionella jordanis]VEH12476.1 putative periplasmic solute-binding protein [Legionella jordanis]
MKRPLKLILLACFLLSLFSVVAVGYFFYNLFSRPMLPEGAQPAIVTIDKNTSASTFVHHLKTRHLIPSSRLLLYWIKVKGLAPQLKAGIYEVKPGESISHFLTKVVSGEVLVQSFSIIEGTTINQVKANLANAPFLKSGLNDWQGIQANYLSPEGLLLADTYQYDAGSEANNLLKRANQNLLQYLEYCWKTRDPDLPYQSAYELLIAASILEKETSIPAERKLISGVLVNRLKKHMLLQMDPTVIYALGPSYRGKLSHEDLSVDSPYNTYRYHGLPPTPIAMVGKGSLDAAAHPQKTDYLYFVAKGDGSHQFSVNYEEQKKAISEYQGKGS